MRSSTMTRQKQLTDLKEFFADMDKEDLVIMVGGFVAGTQGYTVLSSLIKFGGDSPSAKIRQARDDAAMNLSAIELDQANNFINVLDVLNTIGSFLPSGVLTQQTAGYGAQGVSEIATSIGGTDPTKVKNARDYLISTIALGFVGMIESYALTRPGTIAGLGEIVQGIGQIIPG